MVSLSAAGFREILAIVVLFLIFLVTLMVVVVLAAFLKSLGAEMGKHMVDLVIGLLR